MDKALHAHTKSRASSGCTSLASTRCASARRFRKDIRDLHAVALRAQVPLNLEKLWPSPKPFPMPVGLLSSLNWRQTREDQKIIWSSPIHTSQSRKGGIKLVFPACEAVVPSMGVDTTPGPQISSNRWEQSEQLCFLVMQVVVCQQPPYRYIHNHWPSTSHSIYFSFTMPSINNWLTDEYCATPISHCLFCSISLALQMIGFQNRLDLSTIKEYPHWTL